MMPIYYTGVEKQNPLTQNSKSDTPSSFLFIENRMFFMFIATACSQLLRACILKYKQESKGRDSSISSSAYHLPRPSISSSHS